jgi:hypothetical protein
MPVVSVKVREHGLRIGPSGGGVAMEVDLPRLLAALGRISAIIGNPNIIGNPELIGNPDLLPILVGNPNLIGNPDIRPPKWWWDYWRVSTQWPWWPPPPPSPWAIRGFDPQPDPPGVQRTLRSSIGFDPSLADASRIRRLLLASAAVANQIGMAAVAAEASGIEGGAARVVSRAIDDWCGTRPPHLPIPWPTQWPFPGPSDGYGAPDTYPGPDNLYPGPDGLRTFEADTRTVGALTLVSVASRLPEGDVRKSLTEGSEKLLKAALTASSG